jgi:hypothetical protein
MHKTAMALILAAGLLGAAAAAAQAGTFNGAGHPDDRHPGRLGQRDLGPDQRQPHRGQLLRDLP